jgi:hypothetical protein
LTLSDAAHEHLPGEAEKYALHKLINLILGIVLLIAVLAFEIDMRFFTKWEVRRSPPISTAAQMDEHRRLALIIHLCFAIPRPSSGFTSSCRPCKFPSPPLPGAQPGSFQTAWLAAGGC